MTTNDAVASEVMVGSSEAGALTISSGGRLSTGAAASIGFTAEGTATVSGANAEWSFTDGQLVIGTLSSGTLTIANGGEVTGLASVVLGLTADGLGVINFGAALGEYPAAAGTLDAADIMFGAGGGQILFNHTSTDFVLSSNMSGAGNLMHMAGTSTLTGDGTGFAGIAAIVGGKLLVDGEFGGTFLVGGAGTLGGAGTVGNTTIGAGGALAPGNTGIGTLTVSGDLAFEAGSTYAVDVGLNGQSDLIAVTGTTTIESGVNLAVSPIAGVTFANGWNYTILQSAGLTGTFETPTVTGDFATFSVAHGPNDVTLTITSASGTPTPTTEITGTLAPGGNGTTAMQNYTGDVVFKTGSTYAVDVGTNGDSDRVVATGTATIESGVNLSISPIAGVTFANGWNYTILQSAGLTGTFETPTVTGDFATFSVAHGANDVTLTITGIPTTPTPPTGITGTLSPGGAGSIATENIIGAVVFEAGSTYVVDVGTNGQSDRVVATGAATIEAGAQLSITPIAGVTFSSGWNYTILEATSRTGQFNAPTVVGDFATFSVGYNPTNVTLTISSVPTPTVDFSARAETPNQRATALAMNTVDPASTVYNALYLVEAGGTPGALDQLSGQIHASTKTALIEDSHFVRDAMNDRLRAAFGEAGTAGQTVMAFGPSGAMRLGATGMEEAPADTNRFALWTRAFGAWGDLDGDRNTGKLKRTAGGFMLGADGLVLDALRLGAVAGWNNSSFDASRASAESDSYHLGAYAGTQWGALSFRSGLAYTWHDIESERGVGINLITNTAFANSLSATYDASTLQAFGELGWRLGTSSFGFEPFANLAHVALETDGFTETGGAAALAVASEKTSTTFTTIGIRVSSGFQLGSVHTIARGTLGWRHAFGDVDPLSTHRFATGDAFTIAGAPIAENAAVVEAGLDFQISPAGTLGLFYSGQHGSGSSENGINARLNLKF